MRKIRLLWKETVRFIVFSYWKRIAINRWKTTGKRQWVIPISGTWKMCVMDNDGIRQYNLLARKNNWKPMEIHQLIRTALYGTPVGSTMERRRNG